QLDDADHCIGFNELKNYAHPPFYFLFCNNSNTIHQQTIQELQPSYNTNLTYRCIITNEIISISDVNNGYFDCLFKDDEMNINYIPSKNQKYRYRCVSSINTIQYISYQQLGDGKSDCFDGSDEYTSIRNWEDLQCNSKEDYACKVFQNQKIVENIEVSYNQYCDSFSNTIVSNDERNCREWICPIDRIRCNTTGQCIYPEWLCDNEFDCYDGSDELNCLRNVNHKWKLEYVCNNTSEHFCLTKQYIQNQSFYRPCISYVLAGDGIINCIGGKDERNTLLCNDGLTLGDRFRCEDNSCILADFVCNGFEDCQDGFDEKIASVCYGTKNQCFIVNCTDIRFIYRIFWKVYQFIFAIGFKVLDSVLH
ncbi:unnamed protein product, partial [Didymodactylos carnosus]